MTHINIDVWLLVILISLVLWGLPFTILCCCHRQCFVQRVWLSWLFSGTVIGVLWHTLGYEWPRHYWADGKNGSVGGLSSWTSTYTTPPTTRLVVPSNEEELRRAVLSAKRPLRVVGSGHSWSATAYTSGTIIDIHKLNKVIQFSQDINITVEAGMKVQDAVYYLFTHKNCLHGVGSIRAQAIGGVVSHGVHGPHPDGLNRHVVGLRVLLSNGTFLDLESELDLRMWRASIGLLGAIVQVTLRVFPLEVLSLTTSPISTFEDLDHVGQFLREGQTTTFTAYLYPSLYCSRNVGWKRVGRPLHTKTQSQTSIPNLELKNQTDLGSRLMLHFNDHMHSAMQYVSWGLLGNVVGCIEQVLADLGHSTLLSGPQEDVLPNDGLIPQFYEIIDYEYMIPLRHCKTFARELIWEQRYGRILIPVCLRLMRGELSCLSMAAEDSCVFGIESMRGMAYSIDVLAIEKRVAELGGLAHFGKVAPGNFQFYDYPCLSQFQEYRVKMDPTNAFLTPYLALVLKLEDKALISKHEFGPTEHTRSFSVLRIRFFGLCAWIVGFLALVYAHKGMQSQVLDKIHYEKIALFPYF